MRYKVEYMGKDIKAYEETAAPSGIILGNGLILINLLSIALIMVFLIIPSAIIRPILAVPFLMIFPGYTVLAAVFPNREEISNMERLVFSIGLSLAIAIFVGLFLNYGPWGIKIEPVLYSLSTVIFFSSTIAWLRQKRLTKNQRFSFELDLSWLKRPGSSTNSLITVILLIAIFGALSFLLYVFIQPTVPEAYSEFYLLGQGDQLEDYPQVLAVGDEGSVNVGIVNHEGRDVIYSIAVNPSFNSLSKPDQVVLSDGQTWQGLVTFRVSTPGEDKEIEFLLYRDGDNSPYRQLHLMIDATS